MYSGRSVEAHPSIYPERQEQRRASTRYLLSENEKPSFSLSFIQEVRMKKLVLTFAAAAITALTFTAAPVSAQNLNVSVGTGSPHRTYHRPMVRSRVVVRHDNGRHLGWYKHRAHAKKIIVVKHHRRG
jgi:hypothetical protein